MRERETEAVHGHIQKQPRKISSIVFIVTFAFCDRFNFFAALLLIRVSVHVCVWGGGGGVHVRTRVSVCACMYVRACVHVHERV